MRIAFFVHRFPEISETFIARQIVGLSDLGHQVDIYSERSPLEQSLQPEIDRYRLRERTTYLDMQMPVATGYWSMPAWPVWGKTWLPGADNPLRNWRRLLASLPTFLANTAAAPRLSLDVVRSALYSQEALTLEALYRLAILRRVIIRYNVIHAHFGPVAKNLRFARKLWGVPMIATFHGYDYCAIPRTHGLNTYMHLFDEVDAITIHSEYGRKRLLALNCPPEKLRHLSVGLDPNEFSFRPRIVGDHESVRILTVARLVEIKGVRYAIEAIAKLKFAGHRVQYDIIGDGPERSSLETQIKQLGLCDTVHLHGARGSLYVSEAMAQSHIFLLPSINLHGDEEGTPVSLMEAQASGMPVLASRTGGIPEVVREGCSGLLFPERDTDAIADKMIYLLGHRGQWAQMGACGRAHVLENFDLHKLSRQLVSIYQQLIEASRGLPS